MNTSRPKKRISYHTSLKTLVKRNLLEDKYLSNIPRCLIYKWRKEPDEKYFGFELNDFAGKYSELIQEFANNHSAQNVFKAYLSICNLIMFIANKAKTFNKSLRNNKAKVVETIESASQIIGLSKALQCIDISRSRYYNWYIEVKRKCRRSPIRFCLKTNPQQLTAKEIGTMKHLLLKEEFTHWPIASVSYYAIREKLVVTSLQTWYKYAKLLGIKRVLPKFDKRKALGIRAERPNEYWHADVTLYELTTGVKVYIYLLMDNFSRRILSWKVSDKLRASIRLDTIKEALLLVSDPKNLKLLVDGGTENNNEAVDSYIETTQLKKLIAQKEINFSNSMIEAMNKIIKHAYLAGKSLYSIQALEVVLKESIEDYNIKRPHLSLKGLTPDEAYSGIEIQNIDYQVSLAENRVQRLILNKQNRCLECY